jgi:hypothetical protein
MSGWMLIFFTLWGCSEEPSKVPASPYFDLKSYMAQEIQKVSATYSGNKTVLINGEKESMSVSSKILSDDLLVFKNSHINKPSWIGLYQIDSVLTPGQELSKIIYKAVKPTLKTQSLILTFSSGQISKIEIVNITKARIADANQVLVYEPEKGYSLENKQKLMLFPESVISIKTVFIKN